MRLGQAPLRDFSHPLPPSYQYAATTPKTPLTALLCLTALRPTAPNCAQLCSVVSNCVKLCQTASNCVAVILAGDEAPCARGCASRRYDVHGKELHPQGWPPVVQRVLAATHSADYDLEADVPPAVRAATLTALRAMGAAFRDRVAREAEKERRREGKINGKGNGKGGSGGGPVRWGFKAPVTMYLLPFWAEVFPGATFVHVVRDGRDMCFHWLQSPVKRYWPHLFPETFAALAPAAKREASLVPSAGSYEGRAYLFDVPRLNLVRVTSNVLEKHLHRMRLCDFKRKERRTEPVGSVHAKFAQHYLLCTCSRADCFLVPTASSSTACQNL